MIRRLSMYAGLVAVFVVSVFFMSQMPSSQEKAGNENSSAYREETLKRVQVMRVEPSPLRETILVPGVIEANEDVAIGATITGLLEKVFVKEGDFVDAGDPLFQIDLRERQALLEENLASLELARKNYKRLQSLKERGNITEREFDEAAATRAQLEASIKRLKVEVSKGNIHAPTSGVIDRVDVDQGEFMNEGMIMARLLNLDQVEVTVGVPEKHVDSVSKRSSAMVSIDALKEHRNAEIKRVAYGANPNTNTFETKLILDNPDYQLRPGMIVQAEIVIRNVENALMIPLFSLVKSANGMNVFVEKNNVVEERPVELGAYEKDKVEIQSGLSPGESVVVIGQQDLSDEQQVKVMETIQSGVVTEPVEDLR